MKGYLLHEWHLLKYVHMNNLEANIFYFQCCAFVSYDNDKDEYDTTSVSYHMITIRMNTTQQLFLSPLNVFLNVCH